MQFDQEQERHLFEHYFRERMMFGAEELEWQPERNCYKRYQTHLAWCGWRYAREHSDAEVRAALA